ncbi:hypothetical protein K435DRAFT_805638 [Dendrothele bispora CBS 962.96]|uniref:NACHT domain-containing protein n=1 Tax=Dendrothele bispora (strain CBS 962.96) TaxID=1314807 RepID=A0A4S8LB30_DENBC|nr:hypothetical protein K435DRAFT_805638 [Dendrothele bispora CBS 962.96]
MWPFGLRRGEVGVDMKRAKNSCRLPSTVRRDTIVRTSRGRPRPKKNSDSPVAKVKTQERQKENASISQALHEINPDSLLRSWLTFSIIHGVCQKGSLICQLLSLCGIMALPRQTLNDPNSRDVQASLPLIPRRRLLNSLEQDGSNSERRTKPRLEVDNFEEQRDVPKSPTLDSTSRVASFARSHHNTFHYSTINTIGGDQINFTDSKGTGLRLLYQEIAQVGAFYDSEDRFPPPRCHPQTREAVLADISAWITEQNTSLQNSNQDSVRSSQRLVHWLYGPAGVGKSAIAQTLAESLKDSHLAATFFFSRSSSKRNNPRTLFTTVAYCLAVSGNTELRAAIDKVIRDDPALLSASIKSQFLKLVVKPLESLPRERWRNLPKVVIIDGLDECQGSDSQRRVLTTILSLLVDEKGRPRYRIPLRFLIASRPEPQIRDIFNKPKYLDITTRTELGDNYSTSRDIERYLRDSFHKIARTSDAMRGVPLPWPSHGVIDNLVQKASGQFIYASTLLKYVSDEYSHPVEQLELALGLPIGDPDAFSDLDLLYRQIMSSSRNRPRLLQILGAFNCLRDNSISQIENMLLLSPGVVLPALHDAGAAPWCLALSDLGHELDYDLHLRSYDTLAKISICHPYFYPPALDPNCGDWYFIDFSKGHSLLAKCYLKKVRLNPRFQGNRFWSHNFRWSVHELSLVKELVKTIELLREYELLEAIDWLQRYPDKCHIVNNAIDKCTKRIKISRSSYLPLAWDGWLDLENSTTTTSIDFIPNINLLGKGAIAVHGKADFLNGIKIAMVDKTGRLTWSDYQ